MFAASSSPKRSTRRSSTLIISRSGKRIFCGWPKNGSTRSSTSGPAPHSHDGYEHPTSDSDRGACPALRPHRRGERPQSPREVKALLWILWPQRRGQDDEDQVIADV